MIFSGVNISYCTELPHFPVGNLSLMSHLQIGIHPVSVKLLEVLLHYLSIGPGCLFIFNSMSRDGHVTPLSIN